MTHTEESLRELLQRACIGGTSYDELRLAIREVLAERDENGKLCDAAQDRCARALTRTAEAESECERLRSLLKQVEWTPQGKCPVCLGWEVIKGQGECYRVHTKTCALHAAIKDQP